MCQICPTNNVGVQAGRMNSLPRPSAPHCSVGLVMDHIQTPPRCLFLLATAPWGAVQGRSQPYSSVPATAHLLQLTLPFYKIILGDTPWDSQRAEVHSDLGAAPMWRGQKCPPSFPNSFSLMFPALRQIKPQTEAPRADSS